MDLIKIQTSAIIIGAGPAGAGASIFLTKAGIPHVILEKDLFPRDKVCGDACSGKTAFVLRKANPAWMQEIFSEPAKFKASDGILFAAPNGKQLSVPFKFDKFPGEPAAGFTTTRLDFDDWLFRKLPSPLTRIFEQADIESIERPEANLIRVIFRHESLLYDLSAPVIVAADGDKSQVRKYLHNGNLSTKSYSVGLRAYYEGVTGMHEQELIELHFLEELMPGYLWIFPLPNGQVNVGVGILSEKLRRQKMNLREAMLAAIQHNPTICHRFTNAKRVGKIQGWGLPMHVRKEPISGDNYFLTGDAASLIDPFSGEGIGNALYSGMLAAFAIEKCLAARRYDATFIKEQYDDILYKRIGGELKISATLQRLCRYPWLFNFVVNKAHKSPSLRHTISCMFTDMDLREQLRKPGFYAAILFNR